MIEKKPFTQYNLDDENNEKDKKIKEDTFTIKMNPKERKDFEEGKRLILQSKDSTAMKQLAKVGTEVLLSKKQKLIDDIILNNYRKNIRMNVFDFD